MKIRPDSFTHRPAFRVISSSCRPGGLSLQLSSLAITLLLSVGVLTAAPDAQIKAPKQEHLAAIQSEKMSRTPAQAKLDTHLLFAARKDRGEEAVPGVPTLQVGVAREADGRVRVQIRTDFTAAVFAALEKHGATVLASFPNEKTVIALVGLQQIEKIAELDDVKFIELPPKSETEVGPIDTEGDKAHDAINARIRYATDGTGVKVGVVSNGIKSLPASQAAGELPAHVNVLPNQQGEPTQDEGTAMLEIVHDIAPGAALFYATGADTDAGMATNIRDLAAAGCKVIIDDVTYFNESPFQDGKIAQATADVSAQGVLVFSSASNAGNKDSDTASTWEGDFADGGTPDLGVQFALATVHSFGTQNFNTNPSGRKTHVDLFWSDPLGKSGNDYDLVLTDDAGNVTDMSTRVQKGAQDPYEAIDDADPTAGTGRRGTRIFIVKNLGAEPRFLHLSTDRNPLAISTQGSTRGHHACGAANVFGVAAVPATRAEAGNPAAPTGPFPNPFTTANKVETFSSDGPRRIFYETNGAPITPGNLSSTGGRVLTKPDIAAADGGNTSVENYAPFFGTSAAAPHAGAIAALLLSKFPNASPAQIRAALVNSALDIQPAGVDRDSGAGIIMPLPALKKLGPPPALIALVGPPPDYSNNPNQVVQKPSSFVNSVTVYIRITSAPPGGGSVHVFTQDGNARSEEPYHEYDAVNEIKTFSAGDSYIPIQMRVYATPNFASGNGTFTLNLDTEVHGIITKAQALITILDTNPPSVNLSVADTQVVETQPAAQVPGGNANAEFTVTLSGPSDRLVTINAATTDGTAKAGTDYTATQVSLAFLPGETRKVVMVPVLDTPGRNEPEETFSLILSTPVNANVSKGAAICTIHQPVTPGPAVNISTRLRVLTGENVLIGGFIVTGTKPKTVLIRGLGPSLPLADKLLDPTLQLFDGAGKLLASNDDWQSNQAAAIRATTIPPTDPKESAIIATLAPNAGYTAILAGKNAGKGGGLVEIYDLSLSSDSALANISTRGFVDAGDNVMIGGFIVGVNSESAPTRMIIRGIGPSLPVKGKLQDPFLELHDANGATIATNDNWKDTQQKEIEFTGIPPSNNLESAIVKTLTRGKYTAVLRGKGGGVGVGLVEAYKLN